MKTAVALLLLALAMAGCRPGAVDEVPARIPPTSIAAPARAPPAMAMTVTQWQCDDLQVSVQAAGRDGPLRLSFSGRGLSLPAASSSSGGRHADQSGNAFWSGQDGAVLILAGEAKRACRHATRLSPWNDAAARGVVFRAVGNEPGWFVEVGRGDTPSLLATLDYGDRKIRIAHVRGFSGLRGWYGHAADGSEVKLLVETRVCHDGMSGAAFEASAQLTVAGRRYEGCGAFLDD